MLYLKFHRFVSPDQHPLIQMDIKMLVTVRLVSNRTVPKTLTKQQQDNEINKSTGGQRCE